MEKAGDVEAKSHLESPFYVKDIDARCPRGQRPSTKKNKEDTYREPRDETSKDKGKPQTSSSAYQPQIQAPKKDKQGRRGGHEGHPAIRVNATPVAKKDKDRAPKDLSHVECYTCHQKGHYANKCPDKPKNEWRSRRPPRQ